LLEAAAEAAVAKAAAPEPAAVLAVIELLQICL
jgi:hypothetical protein